MITVITPLHAPGNQFIEEAYRSLLNQTVKNWTWIVLLNRGGELPKWILEDAKVQTLTDESDKGIGYLKRKCSDNAKDEFIVELDNDDILAPEALEKIIRTFKEEGADFVYSDFAEFQISEDGDVISEWRNNFGGIAYPYSELYGWEKYQVDFMGFSKVWAMRAPDATAHNIRLVDWAPNHVRAWRKRKYFMVGGHNPRLKVADDHDLVVRMFLDGAKFVRIPECLYFYRVHPENTVSSKNAEIRDGTWGVYNRNIWKLMERWSEENFLLHKVDLCGGSKLSDGIYSVRSKSRLYM